MVERASRVIQKRQCRAGQREIDQVARQAVRDLLNGSARAFGAFHQFDDAAECGVLPDLVRLDLENSRLIDGSSEHARAGDFFHRHRFAGDGGLIDERMSTDHHAIHGKMPSRPHQHNVADVHVQKSARGHAAVRSHLHGLRQQVQQLPDGASAAPHRHPFDDFGDQHEQRNQKRGEEFADGRSRRQGDGHGKLHGHAPLEQVGNGFFEDRQAADDDTRQRQPIDAGKARNPTGPDHQQNQPYESNAGPLFPASRVIVLLGLVFVAGRAHADLRDRRGMVLNRSYRF